MATTWLLQTDSIKTPFLLSGSRLSAVFVHALTPILYHTTLVLSLEIYECIFMRIIRLFMRAVLL